MNVWKKMSKTEPLCLALSPFASTPRRKSTQFCQNGALLSVRLRTLLAKGAGVCLAYQRII